MEYLGLDKPVNKITPLVSVSVITYQQVNFISECLEGILMQETDFDFEIVIGEDNSTDGTRAVCKEYADKYPDKIRLFLRTEEERFIINGRKTERFNLVNTIECARGKYIAFCEGDDYWTDKNKLQNQVDLIVQNNAAYCYHDAGVYLQKEKKLHPQTFIAVRKFEHFTQKDLTLGDLYFHSVIHLCTLVMLKPATIPAYIWELPYGDIGIFSMALSGGKGIYYNKVSSVYRQHAAGWSRVYGFTHRERLKCAFLIDAYYGYPFTKEIFENLYSWMGANQHIDNVAFESGKFAYNKSLRLYFFNLRLKLFKLLKK